MTPLGMNVFFGRAPPGSFNAMKTTFNKGDEDTAALIMDSLRLITEMAVSSISVESLSSAALASDMALEMELLEIALSHFMISSNSVSLPQRVECPNLGCHGV